MDIFVIFNHSIWREIQNKSIFYW